MDTVYFVAQHDIMHPETWECLVERGARLTAAQVAVLRETTGVDSGFAVVAQH